MRESKIRLERSKSKAIVENILAQLEANARGPTTDRFVIPLTQGKRAYFILPKELNTRDVDLLTRYMILIEMADTEVEI